MEIWLHKSRVDNPLLCAEDGPVYQLRRWYEQFYRDAADIEPDMVARYEFEVDTTRAVAGWEAEVAQNLAAGRRPGPSGSRRASAGLRQAEMSRRAAPSATGRRAPRRPAAGRVRSLRRDRRRREVQPAAHVGAVDRGGGGPCAEFRARAAEGTRSALVEGCAALRDSIDAAVASGRLAVSPPVYERARAGAETHGTACATSTR